MVATTNAKALAMGKTTDRDGRGIGERRGLAAPDRARPSEWPLRGVGGRHGLAPRHLNSFRGTLERI